MNTDSVPRKAVKGSVEYRRHVLCAEDMPRKTLYRLDGGSAKMRARESKEAQLLLFPGSLPCRKEGALRAVGVVFVGLCPTPCKGLAP